MNRRINKNEDAKNEIKKTRVEIIEALKKLDMFTDEWIKERFGENDGRID